MYRLRSVSDPEECRRLWQRVVPPVNIADRWEVRDCFQRHYKRRPHFVVAEDGGHIRGLLPLSWMEDCNRFGYFPGEIWDGKTWLEQNRIIASDPSVLQAMLNYLDRSGEQYHLRYLMPFEDRFHQYGIDEVGYLFNPPDFGYSMDRYFDLFSHKSIKRITREVAAVEARGIEYRYDRLEDFDLMVAMNRERYGASSYFSDPRFTESIRDLAVYLARQGWLRVVTVLLEGTPAAVDLGAVYRGTCTLLAGGTSALFPGVAKVINLHHMRWACEQRLDQVDFLCGEFSWKPMFHLTPRPLYLLTNVAAVAVHPEVPETVSLIGVPYALTGARERSHAG